MQKLDRYILYKYFTTTFFMVLVFSVIAVVIDSSEKADDFVKSGLSPYQIFTEYFIGFIPFIISMIFPLMTFIAVIYFTSKLSLNSEIVAMLSCRVPFQRFLQPYLIGALVLAAMFWVASQYYIPKANEIRGNFQSRYVDSKNSYEIGQYYSRGNNFYIRVDSNSFAGLRNYDTSYKSANGGFFFERIVNHQLVYNVRADNLRWDTAKKTWLMENGVERTFQGLQETLTSFQQKEIRLNLLPSEIKPDKYLKDKMTTPQLVRFIRAEEARGTEGLNDYKVERYRRDATPCSVFIMTLIGAVIASRKTRGGSGLHLALGIILAAVFVVMDKFSLTFSTKSNFPPLLAAWTPNLVFAAVAAYLYRQAPK